MSIVSPIEDYKRLAREQMLHSIREEIPNFERLIVNALRKGRKSIIFIISIPHQDEKSWMSPRISPHVVGVVVEELEDAGYRVRTKDSVLEISWDAKEEEV